MTVLKNLTQHQINQGALHCPPNVQRIELCLADLPGAYALVTPTNQTWYYRAKLDGKNRHYKIGPVEQVSLVDLKKQVTQLRGQLASKIDLKGDAAPKNGEGITLREYFRQYLERAKQTKKSWIRDVQAFKHIDVTWGNEKLTDLTLAMVHRQRTDMMNSGLYKAATVNHSTKLWRQLIRQSSIEGLRPPLLGIKLLPVSNFVENYLDDEGLARLLKVFTTHQNRIVCLIALWLLSTGARSGEAMKAKWSDVDRERRLWKIGAAQSKGKIAGSVFLNSSALNVLDQLDTQGRFEHLFINPKTGKRYTTISKSFNRIKVLAGIENYRPHDLRHQHAVLLINSGRTLWEVSTALRHKDANGVTVRYAHLTSKTMQDVSNCADAGIRRAMAVATAR